MDNIGERFLQYILSVGKDEMDIKFHQMDSNGQITFLFPISDIKDEELRVDIDKCHGEVMAAIGAFYVNLIGQMVVKKNVTQFFEYYRDLSDSDYNTKVMAMEYVSFGIGCSGGFISMVFHSSLLYNVFMALLSNDTKGEDE